METQSKNIKKWTKEAKKRKSKGFVDICDTFDYSHYPIFFGGEKDTYKTSEKVILVFCSENSMQKNFGVYNI